MHNSVFFPEQQSHLYFGSPQSLLIVLRCSVLSLAFADTLFRFSMLQKLVISFGGLEAGKQVSNKAQTYRRNSFEPLPTELAIPLLCFSQAKYTRPYRD